MPIGKPHILSVTDVRRGIQALAAFLLGDASLWTELVSINQLSPPYFTTNPAEKYGPAAAAVTLTNAVSANTETITIPNQPQSTNTLYLSASGVSGLVAEAVSVRSYDGTTFNLSTPLQNSYPPGTEVQLFAAYYAGNTQVLLPGDVIYLPIPPGQNFTVSSTGNLTDVFGSDIASPVSFSSGDINTVSGVATLNQRLAAALGTMVKSLPLHPEWGSRLLQSVGRSAARTQWSALIRECLMKLPEVENVTNTAATQRGDKLYISATVHTNTSPSTIELVNMPLTIVGAS